MKTGLLITLAVVAVAAVAVYNQLSTPRPLDERLGDAMHELQQGNLGNAADEMSAATYGEKIATEAEQAYGGTKAEAEEAINALQNTISPTTH